MNMKKLVRSMRFAKKKKDDMQDDEEVHGCP